ANTPLRLTHLAFSAGGKELAAGGTDTRNLTIRIWKMAQPEKAREITIAQPNSSVSALRFAPDAGAIAVGVQNQTIHVLAATDGKELRRIEALQALDHSFAFSSDGKKLVANNRDKVDVVDVATGKILRQLAAQTNGSCLALAADNRTLAVGGY